MSFILAKTFHYHIARFYKVKKSQPVIPSKNIESGVAYKIKDTTIILLLNKNQPKLHMVNYIIDPIYRDIDIKNDTQKEVKKLVKMAMEILE